ncbi:MAG: hypothetical protein WCC90_19495 [Methylocella sp.]
MIFVYKWRPMTKWRGFQSLTASQRSQLMARINSATSPAIGSLFRISFPTDWKDDEMYDFNWSDLGKKPDRFEK